MLQTILSVITYQEYLLEKILIIKYIFTIINLLLIKIDILLYCTNSCLSLGTMPLLKNLLPLRTIALRYIARNLELFWKRKWKRELRKITKASDDILLDIRKNYLNPLVPGGER